MPPTALPAPDIEIGLRRPVKRDCPGRAQAAVIHFTFAAKKLRPALGGELAARDPVWDGEGWGCDRVACLRCLLAYRALAVAAAGWPSPSETHIFGSLWD